jgi:hypothetical protein
VTAEIGQAATPEERPVRPNIARRLKMRNIHPLAALLITSVMFGGLANCTLHGRGADDPIQRLWAEAQRAAGSDRVIRGGTVTLSGRITVSYAPDRNGPLSMTFHGLDRFEYEDTRSGQHRYRIDLSAARSLIATGDKPFGPVAAGADEAFRARWSRYALMYLAALPRVCEAKFSYLGFGARQGSRVEVIGINGPCTPDYRVSFDTVSHRVVAIEYPTTVGQGGTGLRKDSARTDLGTRMVKTLLVARDVRPWEDLSVPTTLLRSNDVSWEKIELDVTGTRGK